MTLFSLNDTDCGLTCTTGAGKTEQEDGRNKALFISSHFKTRKQNKNNKRTDRERFASFIERIQTHVAFGWLRKNFMPENFLDDQIMLCFEVILQRDWPIEQCLLRSI